MQEFTMHKGVVAPLDRANVDTDQIIPKQFLKSIKRTGFGPNLFDAWRYLDEGYPGQDASKRPLNPDFMLNQQVYLGASILLARDNFGCGSSREHAPWALEGFGIRCVIAPSFADIFFNNCFKNGILPIVLSGQEIDQLFQSCKQQPGCEFAVDLADQKVWFADQQCFEFSIESFYKHCLLNGLDDIDLTLQHAEKIDNYEQQRRQQAPWLYNQS